MNNILSLLENYTLDTVDDIAKGIAEDFRKRRIEKNLTREQVAEKSGIAMAMEYTSEVKNIFSEPKYSTMEELTQIRKNTGKKRAHKQ